MSYKLLSSGGVQRLADGACIPPTTDNLDWVDYLAFVAAGGVTLPVDPTPGPASAAAMVSRQREQAIENLDAAIGSLPAAQQEPYRLIQQLLKE